MIVRTAIVWSILLLSNHSVLSNDSKWKNLYDSVYHSMNGDVESNLNLLAQAEDIALENKNKNHLAKTYWMMGYLYKLKGDLANAMRYYHGSLRLYDNLGNSKAQVEILQNLGTLSLENGLNYPAERYFKRRLDLANSKNLDLWDVYHDLAISQREQYKYDLALQGFIRAWLFLLKHGIKDETEFDILSEIFNQIGITWKQYALDKDRIDLMDSARIYYEKALDVSHSNITKFHPTNNIGNLFLTSGEYDSAQYWFEKALKIGAPLSQLLLVPTLNNLGKLHFFKGEYYLADSLFKQSINYNLNSYSIVEILRDRSLELNFNNLNELLVSIEFLEKMDTDNGVTRNAELMSKLKRKHLEKLMLSELEAQQVAKEELLKVEEELAEEMRIANLKQYLGMFVILLLSFAMIVAIYKVSKMRSTVDAFNDAKAAIRVRLKEINEKFPNV